MDGNATQPAYPGTKNGHFEQSVFAPEMGLYAHGPFQQDPNDEIPIAGVGINDDDALEAGQPIEAVRPTQCAQDQSGRPRTFELNGVSHGCTLSLMSLIHGGR